MAERGLGDQRKAAAPVVAVAVEQAHALAVTLDVVTIVLDLWANAVAGAAALSKFGGYDTSMRWVSGDDDCAVG